MGFLKTSQRRKCQQKMTRTYVSEKKIDTCI